MSSGARTITLNNGVEIPSIGAGAGPDGWTYEQLMGAKAWMLTAIKAGYRHFDTALVYGTEKALGEAIRESGIPREEFFITTKLPWTYHGRVSQGIETSLKNLGTDYVDLYLMHAPLATVFKEASNSGPVGLFPHSSPFMEGDPFPVNPDGTLVADESLNFLNSYPEMEKLLDSGKARAIGVSNFSVPNLEKLLQIAKVVPAVNQIETHPYLTEEALVDYCQKKGIAVEAYTPGGRSSIRTEPLILELASKYGATANQVILGWHIARGTIPLPKSSNAERQKENFQVPTLNSEDVKKISALNKNERSTKQLMVNGKIFGWTPEQFGWLDLLE